MFENIMIFNTAIMSQNIGDYIIVDSAKKQMEKFLVDKHILEVPTHCSFMHSYQKEYYNQLFGNYNVKLLFGTNLLNHNLFRRVPTWNLNLNDISILNNIVLIGVGTDSTNEKINKYTRRIYEKVLAKDIIHSTRDDRTCKMLIDMGYKAVNTGCPSMWSFTHEFCKKISRKKSDKVVFTITDYDINENADKYLVNTLVNNYKEVYFWPQGSGDYDYYKRKLFVDNVKIINPSLNAYDHFLENTSCDYVGTRLHAGMRAMQKEKRTIIISIDNRVKDIIQSLRFNVIEREEIIELEKLINMELDNDPGINDNNIKLFKKQFGI